MILRLAMLLACVVASGAASAGETRPGALQPAERVVYEIPTRPSAKVVLQAVALHLDRTQGKAIIAVVVHGSGVEALLAGARDDGGVAFAPSVGDLAARGVDFAVCGATLRARGIAADRVLPQGRIVDGGNAELARLARAGYRRLN